MVPVAQETTANTVRLPYSFSRRFSLVAWCEASLEILHVHPLSLSVLQELQRGLICKNAMTSWHKWPEKRKKATPIKCSG